MHGGKTSGLTENLNGAKLCAPVSHNVGVPSSADPKYRSGRHDHGIVEGKHRDPHLDAVAVAQTFARGGPPAAINL